jgi:hypothetical protein
MSQQSGRRSSVAKVARPSYAVECILAWRRPSPNQRVHAAASGQRVPVDQFFVKWEGFDQSEGTWQEKKDFAGARGSADPPMIADFLRLHPEPFVPDWLVDQERGQIDPSTAKVQAILAELPDYDRVLEHLPLSVLRILRACLATPEGVEAVMRLA